MEIALAVAALFAALFLVGLIIDGGQRRTSIKMRIQEITRHTDEDKDGLFASKDDQGKPGINTEHRVVLSPIEKQVLQTMESMDKSGDASTVDSLCCSLVQQVMEYRGEVLRKLTEATVRKRNC